ncbi:hypothetical protein AB1K70_19120 [Bremerella sp. JC770]|uniref:hypothetical protein n=1 Tax=Bremerella sp. JC770 TaxID=3232137 RepID=UPI003457B4E8
MGKKSRPGRNETSSSNDLSGNDLEQSENEFPADSPAFTPENFDFQQLAESIKSLPLDDLAALLQSLPPGQLAAVLAAVAPPKK